MIKLEVDPMWKKLLAKVLKACRIIDNDSTGEITLGINKGSVVWRRDSSTHK